MEWTICWQYQLPSQSGQSNPSFHIKNHSKLPLAWKASAVGDRLHSFGAVKDLLDFWAFTHCAYCVIDELSFKPYHALMNLGVYFTTCVMSAVSSHRRFSLSPFVTIVNGCLKSVSLIARGVSYTNIKASCNICRDKKASEIDWSRCFKASDNLQSNDWPSSKSGRHQWDLDFEAVFESKQTAYLHPLLHVCLKQMALC